MDLPEVAVLEDIYVPNLKVEPLHPHVSPAEKPTHVYYLAYGSNMYAIRPLLLVALNVRKACG